MRTVHPSMMGVAGGLHPPTGVEGGLPPHRGVQGPAGPRRGLGGNAPEAKNRVVFGTWFSAHCIIVPVLELVVSGVGKHYIFISWLFIL